MKFEQSSLTRTANTADLSHRKFMKMADQVMAEFKKIDAIFEKCFGATRDQKKAA